MPSETTSAAQVEARMRTYIKETWTTLTRSHKTILPALEDTKIHNKQGNKLPLFISNDEDKTSVTASLLKHLSDEEAKIVEVLSLKERPDNLHGLLYLPHPFVVPGGRFNEMYGWDSYFILLGLLKDNMVDLAKAMVDNSIYEIIHYGSVLNANRTYYLTRSQPPFVTQMALAVYAHTQDKEWLLSLIPAMVKYYEFFTSSPHSIDSLSVDVSGDGADEGFSMSLSRYYALGDGPAPEVTSEVDETGKTHYERIKEYYRNNREEVEGYDVSDYYNESTDTLTALFYKGDRSMRESGFDPSNRFGHFNVDIIHYAPVCLNSLLYRYELDLAMIFGEIVDDSEEAMKYTIRAETRKELVDKYLWDEKRGLYFDYNFLKGERREYEFSTTFFPLWAGLASEAQAKRVYDNLHIFEAPGGVRTSTRFTGCQWDSPYGWAPLQLVAVRGLQKYGYNQDASRLSKKFLSLVTNSFAKTNIIVEKYNVEDVSPAHSTDMDVIQFGYNTNEVGFGWTNAVILEFL